LRVAVDLMKGFLVPGSISFLVLALAAGVSMLYGGETLGRWGRRGLTVLAVLYWALSTQFVADWLSAGLVGGFRALADASAAGGADTIVVLSVGSTTYRLNGQEVPELGKDTAFNVLEAARVYRLLGHPLVIASGGITDSADSRMADSEMMRDALVKLGLPANRIQLESRSRNTREQALLTAEILRKRGIRAAVLVTAPEHMKRAIGSFEALGFPVVPSASAFRAPQAGSLWRRLQPSRGALLQSDWAVYEYLAQAFYWLQGWLP
jgi:uncharacterized SAM-binding protein YcdF (DUF218 family)